MGKIYYNGYLRKYSRQLRNESTLGEIILWKRVLRAKQFHGYQFNRQFIIGDYIVDFICRKLKLIIEVDGYSHNFKYKEDMQRDKHLNELGFKVFRIKEMDVRRDIDDVVAQLENFLVDVL